MKLFIISCLTIATVSAEAPNSAMTYYSGSTCDLRSVIKVNIGKQSRTVPEEPCKPWVQSGSFYKTGMFSASSLKGSFGVDENDSTVRYFYKVGACIPEGIVKGAVMVRCEGDKGYLENYEEFDCKTKSSFQSKKTLVCKTFDGAGGEKPGAADSSSPSNGGSTVIALTAAMAMFLRLLW